MSSKGGVIKRGGFPPNVGLSGSEGCRKQRFVHLTLRLEVFSFLSGLCTRFFAFYSFFWERGVLASSSFFFELFFRL